VIDLYSDTVTRPTVGLLQAMVSARVGDEQRGDDPTTAELEQRLCELLGQPRALLFPTATMANQVAVLVQCSRGAQVVCHRTAHVYTSEAGGLGANAGATVLALDGPRGTFDLQGLALRADPRDVHRSPTELVVVENTSNLGGGAIWSDTAFQDVVRACRSASVRVHLDGARLFNAAVARGRPVSYWSQAVDSVQVCFSKGLGCPFGAALAGSEELIERARRARQRFGGALRQSGVIAGGILYALNHHVQRLADDHARLDRIAQVLRGSEMLEVVPHETNIVLFRHRTRAGHQLASELKARGVWVSEVDGWLRICTHLDIDDAAVAQACVVLREVCG
jgi:threonine aldolase